MNSALVLLTYDRFYDGTLPEVKGLICSIPSNTVCNILASCNAMIYTRESEQNVQIAMLNQWTEHLSDEIKLKATSLIQLSTNQNFVFFNSLASLEIIQIALSNYVEGGAVSEFSDEQEENLFKAILVINQKISKATDALIPLEHPKDEREKISMFLPLQLSQTELIEYKDFHFSLIKGYYLCMYLEQSEWNTTLNNYLSLRNIDSWQSYIINIIHPVVHLFDNGFKTILRVVGKEMSFDFFWDSFCFEKTNFNASTDFSGLRNAPLLKVAERDYIVIFYNFFVDKLYQSLAFEFKKIQGFDFERFRSDLGKTFTEKFFFYKLIKSIHSQVDEHKSGEELKTTLVDGEPDYFFRIGNNGFIFECKDIIIPSQIKQSLRLDLFEKFIKQKLIVNQKNERKGLTQLVNTINSCLNGKMTLSSERIVNFYPILVLTDSQFNVFGVNRLLNSKFQEILRQQELSDYVEPLVVIDMDILIKFHDYFADGTLCFKTLLEEYHVLLNADGSDITHYDSFNQFVHGYMNKNSLWKEYQYVSSLFQEIIENLDKYVLK